MPSIITGHTICCNMFTSNIHLNQKGSLSLLRDKEPFLLFLINYYFIIFINNLIAFFTIIFHKVSAIWVI